MVMTNAERQRRSCERRNADHPVRTVVRPKDRRPRPKRWAHAVGQLRTLQAELRGPGATSCPSPWPTPGPPSCSRACATSTSRPSTSSCRGASAATECSGARRPRAGIMENLS